LLLDVLALQLRFNRCGGFGRCGPFWVNAAGAIAVAGAGTDAVPVPREAASAVAATAELIRVDM